MSRVRFRWTDPVLASLAALWLASCGGASAPTAAPTDAPHVEPVVLGAGNFDALVHAPGRPSLVEFQSPT